MRTTSQAAGSRRIEISSGTWSMSQFRTRRCRSFSRSDRRKPHYLSGTEFKRDRMIGIPREVHRSRAQDRLGERSLGPTIAAADLTFEFRASNAPCQNARPSDAVLSEGRDVWRLARLDAMATRGGLS